MSARRPAVAGLFYPADPADLLAAVQHHLSSPAPREPDPAQMLRALVVPHAGYVYSGPTAGVAYRLLPALAHRIRRVLLLGPAHLVPVRGAEVTAAAAWVTPLGRVTIDEDGRTRLLQAARRVGLELSRSDRAHAPEHSVEVQLPFLQLTLPDAAVLPVLVGAAPPLVVAQAIEQWWADDALIVLSTDLSHYEPDSTARAHDRRTSEAVVRVDPDALCDRDACGAQPLRALLHLTARHRGQVRELDRRTSADTAGTPERVVGYAAFAVEATSPPESGLDTCATIRTPTPPDVATCAQVATYAPTRMVAEAYATPSTWSLTPRCRCPARRAGRGPVARSRRGSAAPGRRPTRPGRRSASRGIGCRGRRGTRLRTPWR